MESSKKNRFKNPFSVLFFGWTIPIFRRGYGKQMESNDVYEPLNEDRSNHLGNRLDR